MSVKLKIILCIIVNFLFCYKICASVNNETNYNEAMVFLTKGLKEEFQIDAKIKQMQIKTSNYIKNNFEIDPNIPSFLIGTSSQILLQKKIAFRGKTPLIGNKYELFINDQYVQLKLLGNLSNLISNSNYWIMGSSNSKIELGFSYIF